MPTFFFTRRNGKPHKPKRLEGLFERFLWWTYMVTGALCIITWVGYNNKSIKAPWFMLFFLIGWLCMIYLSAFSKVSRTARIIKANIAGRPAGKPNKNINSIARNCGLPRNYVRAVFENLASSYSVPAANLSHDDLIGRQPTPTNHGDLRDIPLGLHIDGDDAGLLGDFLLWDLDCDQSRDTKVRLQEISNRKGLTISSLCVALYPLYEQSKILLEKGNPAQTPGREQIHPPTQESCPYFMIPLYLLPPVLFQAAILISSSMMNLRTAHGRAAFERSDKYAVVNISLLASYFVFLCLIKIISKSRYRPPLWVLALVFAITILISIPLPIYWGF